MKKKLIIILAIVLIAAFIVIGIISKNRLKLMEVSSYTVELEDFTREVSANGEIMSQESFQVVSAVSGEIKTVKVEAGDEVAPGDILVEIDREDIILSYRNSQAVLESTRRQIREEIINLRTAYTQALTGFEQSERDYERTQELHKIGSASDEELRLRRDAYQIARQNLTAALQRINFREGRDLDDLRIDAPPEDDEIVESSTEVQQALLSMQTLASAIEDYTFKSTISGIVTSVNIEKGGVLGPGTLVATIHNTRQLEVVSNIDEVDLSYLAEDQDTRIESDSFIGSELAGKVSHIDPIIRRVGDSRVCAIKVAVTEDPENLAIIGASCSIFILVEEKNAVPSIPVEAYSIEEGEKFVYLLDETEEEGVFLTRKQTIETGILGIETVEVTEGLIEGDILVKARVPGLEDAMEVELTKEEMDESEEDSSGKE